ncbi:hypothetical protein BZL29_7505 [Mycobacterium kansasii]|uniref:Uncharacterized protein n=1 Tax=Mycobacterium kansasii TaxID=1768 RepID=A0A1V3WH60_MYCKA|nr:hypothetical protein BZL29_7505 [Mycobacterium kansasii]
MAVHAPPQALFPPEAEVSQIVAATAGKRERRLATAGQHAVRAITTPR